MDRPARHNHHSSRFALVMNERDTAKYSNGRGPTDSLDGNNRREGQGKTLSRAKSGLSRRYKLHAIERKRERGGGNRSRVPTKRLPKRVGSVARETNWRSYRTESVESRGRREIRPSPILHRSGEFISPAGRPRTILSRVFQVWERRGRLD